MADSAKLSRRERQIMDALYAAQEATVLQIQEKLPNAPTPMAIRRMLQILEEKGHIRRRKDGREFVYMPRQGRKRAGSKALKHVIDTFFGGSVEDALAAHLGRRETTLTEDELGRLRHLIDEARKKGN